jgi:hypothetical protein
MPSGFLEFGLNTVQGTAASQRRFQLIDRLTLRMLATRALVLWLLIRIVLAVLGAFAGAGDLGTELGAEPILAPIVGVVFLIDLHATRETTFLANLGVGARHAFAIAIGVTVVMEALIGLIARLVLR